MIMVMTGRHVTPSYNVLHNVRDHEIRKSQLLLVAGIA
jgi:hypothetical protein